MFQSPDSDSACDSTQDTPSDTSVTVQHCTTLYNILQNYLGFYRILQDSIGLLTTRCDHRRPLFRRLMWRQLDFATGNRLSLLTSVCLWLGSWLVRRQLAFETGNRPSSFHIGLSLAWFVAWFSTVAGRFWAEQTRFLAWFSTVSGRKFDHLTKVG